MNGLLEASLMGKLLSRTQGTTFSAVVLLLLGAAALFAAQPRFDE
jgi:hypothetical protein